jgi:pimeloyl-ACP methyl ester carboxylesterase
VVTRPRTASGLATLLSLAALDAAAAPCDTTTLTLDRGETRRLVACLAAPVRAPTLAAPAGINVDYQQFLPRCAVGDQRPGVQLSLRADATAPAGEWPLTLAGADGAQCELLRIAVPDRLVLSDATLRPQDSRGDRYSLAVTAPRGIDLRRACDAPAEFPAGDGLRLAPGPDARARCSRRDYRLTVNGLDQRPGPAKVVLAVQDRTGRPREAVAYPAPPAPDWTADMAESDARYVDVLGIRTRYFVAGRGEPLVLVHGGQPSSMDGSAWDWQQNFAALAREFRVHALDRVGQGGSAHPASLDDYQNYYGLVVEHLRGFLDAMGLERAHLVGHSQGSWPVTRIALDDPARVASLTLVDGTMVAPSRDAGRAIRFYLYLTESLHPAEGETLESARRGMELFSHTGNNLTEQRVRRLLELTRLPKYAPGREWFERTGMSPAHPSFRSRKQQLLDELAAGKLTVPVLVVWGAEDPEGSLDSGLALYDLVRRSSPDAALHVFSRSGHLSFIEHPDSFNRVLVDFATKHRR